MSYGERGYLLIYMLFNFKFYSGSYAQNKLIGNFVGYVANDSFLASSPSLCTRAESLTWKMTDSSVIILHTEGHSWLYLHKSCMVSYQSWIQSSRCSYQPFQPFIPHQPVRQTCRRHLPTFFHYFDQASATKIRHFNFTSRARLWPRLLLWNHR